MTEGGTPPQRPRLADSRRDFTDLSSNGPVRLLDAGQVADLLRVPKSWVYAEVRAGRLPHIKLGRYYRFAPESIAAFVAGLERGPVPYRKYPAPGSGPGGSPDA